MKMLNAKTLSIFNSDYCLVPRLEISLNFILLGTNVNITAIAKLHEVLVTVLIKSTGLVS